MFNFKNLNIKKNNIKSNKNFPAKSVTGAAIYNHAIYVTLSDKKHEIINLEDGCVLNGAIRDFKLLENAFKKLSELTINSPVVIGMPPGDVIIRPVAFPEMSFDDLKSTIDLNFEEYFPFARTDAVLDFSEITIPLISTPAQNRSNVLVAAARRSCVYGIIEAVKNSGLKLESIEPSNIALIRALPESHENLCLIADVHEKLTSIITIWEGKGIFFRSSHHDNDFGAIAQDILSTAQFIETQYRSFTIQRIILTGEENSVQKIVPLLENRSEILTVSSQYIASDGLSERGNQGMYLDLRPRDYLALEKRRYSFNINRVASMVFTGAFIITSLSSSALSFFKGEEIRGDINAQRNFISRLESNKRDLEEENLKLRNNEAGATRILNFVRDDLPILEVLNTLEANAEPGIDFNSINFGKDGNNCIATLDAIADDENLINSLLEGLKASNLFGSIVMPSSNKNDKDRINFKLVLSVLDIIK